jgi:hypothetical protein
MHRLGASCDWGATAAAADATNAAAASSIVRANASASNVRIADNGSSHDVACGQRLKLCWKLVLEALRPLKLLLALAAAAVRRQNAR